MSLQQHKITKLHYSIKYTNTLYTSPILKINLYVNSTAAIST